MCVIGCELVNVMNCNWYSYVMAQSMGINRDGDDWKSRHFWSGISGKRRVLNTELLLYTRKLYITYGTDGRYYVWWHWLTSKRVARVRQHQLCLFTGSSSGHKQCRCILCGLKALSRLSVWGGGFGCAVEIEEVISCRTGSGKVGIICQTFSQRLMNIICQTFNPDLLSILFYTTGR